MAVVAAGANGKHVFDASISKCGAGLSDVQRDFVRRAIVPGDVRDHVPRIRDDAVNVWR